MLDRQPLRFLLADDPGAGKTIMTGLLIKELQVSALPPAVVGDALIVPASVDSQPSQQGR